MVKNCVGFFDKNRDILEITRARVRAREILFK